MNITKAITCLLGVGVFCVYLIASCNEDAHRGASSAASATQAAEPMLLRAVHVEKAAEAADKPAVSRVQPVRTDIDDESVATLMPPAPPEHDPDAGEHDFPLDSKEYKTVVAIVTAYCPCRRCCGRHANGRTSTGTSAWRKGIAADAGALSYGTKVYVPGYGIATVDDTGGAMRRSWRNHGMIHLDIRMTYHWQAKKWGRRVMRVRVYE